MDELIEPCPWCGGEASVGGMIPWIECGNCAATGPTSDTESDAIAAWNRVAAELRKVRQAPVAEVHGSMTPEAPWLACNAEDPAAVYALHGQRVRLVPERGEVE